MVLFTLLELYNDEDTINHHGFTRNVGGETNKQETRKMNIIHQIAKIFGINHSLLFVCEAYLEILMLCVCLLVR